MPKSNPIQPLFCCVYAQITYMRHMQRRPAVSNSGEPRLPSSSKASLLVLALLDQLSLHTSGFVHANLFGTSGVTFLRQAPYVPWRSRRLARDGHPVVCTPGLCSRRDLLQPPGCLPGGDSVELHLLVPALLDAEGRVPSVHEDVAVARQPLGAERARVQRRHAGLAHRLVARRSAAMTSLLLATPIHAWLHYRRLTSGSPLQ